MRVVDKKIRSMSGKTIGGIADITVIFADGNIYRFKGNIRNGAGSHSITSLEMLKKQKRRLAS